MLKKELSEMRKMEAGWFGKEKSYVKKEVIVKNNHYIEEKEKIITEVTELREKYALLQKERLALLQKIKELEAKLASQQADFSQQRNLWA